jgi:hypothetical protein
MDQGPLVDERLGDGWRLVERLVRDGFGVTAAGWLKDCEDGRWYLYIASPFRDQEGGGKAYRHVQSIIRQMPRPFAIGPLDVKLPGTKSPLAQELAALEQGLSVKELTRYRGPDLEKLAAEDAYLYPVQALANPAPETAPGQQVRALAPRTITVVSGIQQQGDTLVVTRKTITLPPGAEVIDEGTETSLIPSGITKVRYEGG